MGKFPKPVKIALVLIFAVFALTSLRAVLVPLVLIIGVSWYFVFRHPEKRKGVTEFASNKFRALIGKNNRTALAITIGAIAIVFAIVFSNNQPQNAGNGKGSGPDIIRATEYYIPSSSYVQHSCPKGYSNRNDGWCYRK